MSWTRMPIGRARSASCPLVLALLSFACASGGDDQTQPNPTLGSAGAGTAAPAGTGGAMAAAGTPASPPASGGSAAPAAGAGSAAPATGGMPPAGSGGGAGEVAAAGSGGSAGQAGSGLTPADFNCEDLSDLNMEVFVDADEAWRNLETMVSFGARHTGSQAEIDWVDWLEQRVRDAGLETTRTEVMVRNGPNGLDSGGPPVSNIPAGGHVTGVLPGMTEDIIVLGVHSDGQNAIEENGALTLLHIAEYLAKVPQQCRKHTFVLALATCHMASCDSTEIRGWGAKFPELVSRAVGGLSPEHQAHKSGSSTINWVGWGSSATLRDKADELRQALGIRASVGTSASAPGTGKGLEGLIGGPVFGGMADALPSGISGLLATVDDPERALSQIDKEEFWKMNVWFAQMAGFMDGLTVEQMRQ